MKKIRLLTVCLACTVIFAPAAFSAQSGAAPAQKNVQLLAAPADWQSRWNQLIAEGRKEGKILIYGDVGPVFKGKLTEVFKRRYGIEVESMAAKSAEVAQKYLTERAANLFLADVLITGQTTTLTLLKPQKALASPKSEIILPEVLDSKVWPRGVLPFMDRDQMALALIAGYMKFVTINKELVRDGEITSYTDLLNPRWRGKITIYDPSFQGNGGAWLTFLMKAFGREAGEAYLRQLAVQDPVITRDQRLQVETVARGKYPISIGAAPQVVQELAQAGAPIAWQRMKEGGLVLPGAFVAALPDKRAHPAAATLMLNFLLSREGQQFASEAMGLPAMRSDLTLSRSLEESVPKPGDKVYWLDEEMILTERNYYPLVREIFGMK